MSDLTMGQSKDIMADAVKAKGAGLSYGKYKAGLDVDYKESDYQVRPAEHIVRKEADESKKSSVAFIK